MPRRSKISIEASRRAAVAHVERQWQTKTEEMQRQKEVQTARSSCRRQTSSFFLSRIFSSYIIMSSSESVEDEDETFQSKFFFMLIFVVRRRQFFSTLVFIADRRRALSTFAFIVDRRRTFSIFVSVVDRRRISSTLVQRRIFQSSFLDQNVELFTFELNELRVDEDEDEKNEFDFKMIMKTNFRVEKKFIWTRTFFEVSISEFDIFDFEKKLYDMIEKKERYDLRWNISSIIVFIKNEKIKTTFLQQSL